MKLRVDPYKLFVWLMLAATFAFGFLEHGVEAQKWPPGCKPFSQFSMGLVFLCLGPSLIATAFNVRDSENAGSIWKKTWPATFLLGIVSMVGGVAKLWTLFGR